jgi:hypothetical protein
VGDESHRSSAHEIEGIEIKDLRLLSSQFGLKLDRTRPEATLSVESRFVYLTLSHIIKNTTPCRLQIFSH